MVETALVTGAFGFVGRHVARALAAQGVFVTGIGHGNWGRGEWSRWGVGAWHTADITLESLITYAGKPELVFHCAGSGSVGFSMNHPQQDWLRTVTSTLEVLEYLRMHRRTARLIIPSSAAVYGVAAKMPITVESPLLPASPYGVHKLMAENLCQSYARHFQVQSVIVRLFSVYGIGLRKQLLWDACSRLQQGVTLFGGTGLETRDWLHVEDAVQLMLVAAQHASVNCPVVNGGVGQAVSIRDVVGLISARLDNSMPQTFSGELRIGDPHAYQADISGALAWGWMPRRDREVEMNAYVDWFLAGAS